MTWVLIIVVAWLAASVVAAMLIAGGIHLAEQRRHRAGRTARGNFVVDLQAAREGESGTASSHDPQPSDTTGSVPDARKPIARDFIPRSERAMWTRRTGTR